MDMKILKILGIVWCSLWTLCGTAAPPAAEIVEQIRKELAPDRRIVVYDVEADPINDTLCLLRGKCDRAAIIDSLEKALRKENIPYMNCITLLPDRSVTDYPEALVTLSSVNLRAQPAHAAEMVSQALMGTPLRVLERHEGWYHVQSPEGYLSWIDESAITLKTKEEMDQWREAQRFIFTDYMGFIYAAPDETSAHVSDLVLGSILELDPDQKPNRKFIAVQLPDGRKGFISRYQIRELSDWANDPLDPGQLEKTARSMLGVPYLWGGTSVKGVDCSGMVKTAYWNSGIILIRDASQQALTGERFAGEEWRNCQKGDLLFFGNATTGRITHVGMYLDNGRFIHSSGKVRINSLDPDADDFVGYPCLSISRIKNRIGTPGITRISEHPWYFNCKH